MYAIIETGGKQYKVQSGDTIFIEKLGVEDEEKVTFDKVVALHNDSELVLGSPYVSGATVTATAVKTGRGKKIRVFIFRKRTGSKRSLGHRQPYTKVQIDEINS